MSEYLGQHWIAAIVIAIVLGALGSALWELVRPFSIKLGNTLFSIITLGIKSRSDRIYKDAALGHHEWPSIKMLLGFYMFILSVPIALQIFYYVPQDSSSYKQQAVNACAIKKGDSERQECIREHYRENVKPIFFGMGLVTVFLLVNFFIMAYTLMRKNYLITEFNQLIHVIRPYIDESKLHLIEQKFALMKCKEDYEELLEDMLIIAKENNVNISDLGYIEKPPN